MRAQITNIFIGAIYFMLGNLDPAVRYRLDVIYLVSPFRAELLEHCSFDLIIFRTSKSCKFIAQVGTYCNHN